MEIKPIRTPEDHENALLEIEGLMDAEPGTSEYDRLEVLATLVDAYENEHFPIDLPDPVAAIRFIMDQRGLDIGDFVQVIGRPNRVYEILNHKRSLTLPMIRQLNREFHIPAEVLIQQT